MDRQKACRMDFYRFLFECWVPKFQFGVLTHIENLLAIYEPPSLHTTIITIISEYFCGENKRQKESTLYYPVEKKCNLTLA